MRLPSEFTTPLDLRAAGPNEWLLLKPLRYRDGGGVWYGVPAGFITDLATIPAPARAFISRNGPSRRPAVLHDWLYCSRILSRAEADALFLDALQAEGVGWATRRTMWAAVRAFGWVYWNKRKDGLETDDFGEL